MAEIASTFKIAYHREKLQAYLRGERIFPATLEIDITDGCTRTCPGCPSVLSTRSRNLSLDFIERLFSRLAGRTKGLLLTGGEPTMAETFPDVLKLAREYGFEDIAIVTNGDLIDDPRVADALLTCASTIRISLYDWTGNNCGGIEPTLRRIKALRTEIERQNSQLQIGVSALTSGGRTRILGTIIDAVQSAGADWIYFHPICRNWGSGRPSQVDQTGVQKSVQAHEQGASPRDFQVFIFGNRYGGAELTFDGYHAAHFLLVVGADGLNYLGAEVKYQPQHVIADLAGGWHDDFLWQPRRLQLINSVKSHLYPALGSRHRGVLYNGFIEDLKRGVETLTPTSCRPAEGEFLFPHVL